MAIPKNSDLTPANKIPGIYIQQQIGGAGTGDANEQSTVLLLGEMLASGAWAPNGVYDINSEQDVIDGAEGASTVGASTIRRQYRAVVAQVGEGNVRVKACPVLEPSGGTAATLQVTVVVADPATLAVATNPTTAGTQRLQVAGDEVSVGFTTSDTAATIAALIRTELLKLKNIPTTIGNLSSATIPLTYNVKGVVGEDLPLRTYGTPGSGVFISIGTLTYATGSTGAGSAKLVMGSQTCTAALADSGSAAAAAAAMKAALLTDDFPLIGGAVATASISLLMRDGRDVRRVAASIVTTTGTTAALTGGSATDGTGSATSFSYNGTLGAGLPNLGVALGNIDLAGSFGEWTTPWASAGSSATGLTAIASAIETAANGDVQKNQHLTVCSVASETAAASLAASVTPALGSSLRYVIGLCTDAGQQAYELAARRAAMFAAWTTPATNSDAAFGGTPFKTRPNVPLNLPSARVRATRATLNAAVVDGLEPWFVSNGSLAVLRGRTTSTSTEEPLWDPSYIRQYDMMRRRLRADGYATFVQPKVKADGIVNQSGEITTDSVTGWAVGEIKQFELEGFFDGADELKSAVKSEIDGSNRSRINVVIPGSPVVMVHQFSIVQAKSAPSL